MVIFIVGKFASLKMYDDVRDIFPFCLLQTVGLTKAVFCGLDSQWKGNWYMSLLLFVVRQYYITYCDDIQV